MPGRQHIRVAELTPQAFAPYGVVLGEPPPAIGDAAKYRSAASDFWQTHIFSAGDRDPEILWVTYRDASPRVDRLEMHLLTEQAVVPLTAEIIQIVARSTASGAPDPAGVLAFRVPVGKGLCMRPGCWHATRVAAGQSMCLMVTRQSTTADLIGHLTTGAPLAESAFADVALQLVR
jgi:ureidoglycolate lyase